MRERCGSQFKDPQQAYGEAMLENYVPEKI